MMRRKSYQREYISSGNNIDYLFRKKLNVDIFATYSISQESGMYPINFQMQHQTLIAYLAADMKNSYNIQV
ncbi:UNVERIFIED_CONTAM: hypothetical protein NCL1_52582 [Trichonephila clavipes]